MNDNPIRTHKHYHAAITKEGNISPRLAISKTWSWECPKCGASSRGTSRAAAMWDWGNRFIDPNKRRTKKRMQERLVHPVTTRKQAKDSYHRHSLVCPGVPGQD